MKQLGLLFAAFLFFTFGLEAQVKEGSVSMSQGSHNALSVEIENADTKLIGDVWKDYMKDRYKVKPKWSRKTNEWMADDAEMSMLGGSNTVDLYAKANESGSDVTFYFWADMGGAYLNSSEHPDRYGDAERMMNEFALEVARERTRRKLKDEQDKLKDIEKELAKLQTAKERYENEIQRAEETIQRAKQDIENNEQDQKNKEGEIEAQKEVIKAVEKKLNDI